MTAKYEALIDQVADTQGVPRAVAQALVDTENAARNPSIVIQEAWGGGSYGLTMITLATARGMGFTGAPSALSDPQTNLTYGLGYLRQMYDGPAGGDWTRARAAYNAGPDMTPWPAADISRFTRNLAKWIPIEQPGAAPPDFPAAPTLTASVGASWLPLLVILGALLPWAFQTFGGKRK
jgi:soluble lytic murein transglycosylase-like protein